MKGRHLVPAPIAVAVGIVEIIFGLCCLLITLSNMQQNAQFIENADKVVAVCTEFGDGTHSSTSYLKSTVSFTYNGKKYENIVIDNYGQRFFTDQKVNLYVNPECPTQCRVHYDISQGEAKTYTMFACLGLGVGSIMTIVGISRIRRGILW